MRKRESPLGYLSLFLRKIYVSHQPERKERNCLNCGTQVAGRYCQNCGQENIVPRQNFWGLTKHFIYDIFHFDGKFFETLKFLFFRPGFVPKEYVQGKRMRYLDPIRMYLFTSAVFFLVFIPLSTMDQIGDDETRIMHRNERLEYASGLYKEFNRTGDSITRRKLDFLLDTSYSIILKKPFGGPYGDTVFPINFDGRNYEMAPEKLKPDTAMFSAPNKLLRNSLQQRYREFKTEYGGDVDIFILDLINAFLKKLPYILFLSLPFFALILKLIYIRRKQFYYSDHAVFTLYHYIFTFILMLLCFLLSELNNLLNWSLITVLIVLIFLSGGVHLYLAMKRFFGQSAGKTFLKFILLNVLAFLIVNLLMFAFIILSVFQL